MRARNQTMGEEHARGSRLPRFELIRSQCSMLAIGAGPAGMEGARVVWKWIRKLLVKLRRRRAPRRR
jgi:hypothetical protein